MVPNNEIARMQIEVEITLSFTYLMLELFFESYQFNCYCRNKMKWSVESKHKIIS